MPCIDSSETRPNKDLYYQNDDTPYSPELGVKYMEKEQEFHRHSKRH